MRLFRKKSHPNVTISNNMAILRQVHRFNQLFGYKFGNSNTIVAKVIVRIGNFQLYPGAEVNRGVTIDGVDLFAFMNLNPLVQVDYDTVNKIYTIVGVQNG